MLSVKRLDVFRRDCAAAGQTDPVAGILSDVTNLVRGYVAKVAALGPVGTIPEKLKSTALDLVAFRLTARMGVEPTKAQETNSRTALALLDDVVSNRFDIDEPAVVTQAAATVVPRITPRQRDFTAGSQSGF